MPHFLVSYLDAARRPAQARVDAADAHAVAAALRIARRRCCRSSRSVRRPCAAAPPRARRSFPLRQFAQQLGVLLRAGIPLLEALVTLKQKSSPARWRRRWTA